MRHTTSKYICTWKNAFVLLLSCYLSYSVNAAEESHETLQGEPFHDHHYVKTKKQDWIDKKITYDKKYQNADLVLALGQQTYPALHQLIQKLADERGINVIIQQGSCGKTSKKLSRKEVDIGAYCCPPMKNDRLPGLRFHTLGIAPIAFVTHPSNPLKSISSIEAQEIYRGEFIQWSEIPSAKGIRIPDMKIQPVVRLHCKKRPGHWRHLLENEDLFAPRIFEVSTIPDMVQQVAKNKAAIGIETLHMLKVHKKNTKLNILKIDGKRPQEEKYVLNGQYPIYRTYNLTTWAGEGKNYKLAIEFVDEIKKYIEKNGQKYGFISPSKLKKSGWKFNNDELIAEPNGMPVIHKHHGTAPNFDIHI